MVALGRCFGWTSHNTYSNYFLTVSKEQELFTLHCTTWHFCFLSLAKGLCTTHRTCRSDPTSLELLPVLKNLPLFSWYWSLKDFGSCQILFHPHLLVCIEYNVHHLKRFKFYKQDYYDDVRLALHSILRNGVWLLCHVGLLKLYWSHISVGQDYQRLLHLRPTK